MELRHLRYFVAVAEEENVTRAALRLHVSQPALSRQVRDLEDELGFPLLLRTAKSVSLTETGRAFLGEARAVLQDMVEYERNQESLALLKLLALGTKDVEQGRLIPARRAFAGLRRRLKNGQGL